MIVNDNLMNLLPLSFTAGFANFSHFTQASQVNTGADRDCFASQDFLLFGSLNSSKSPYTEVFA